MAPEAPRVAWYSGAAHRTTTEPASRERKYSARNLPRPKSCSSCGPSTHRANMLKPMCSSCTWAKPEVSTCQKAPSAKLGIQVPVQACSTMLGR